MKKILFTIMMLIGISSMAQEGTYCIISNYDLSNGDSLVYYEQTLNRDYTWHISVKWENLTGTTDGDFIVKHCALPDSLAVAGAYTAYSNLSAIDLDSASGYEDAHDDFLSARKIGGLIDVNSITGGTISVYITFKYK